MTASAAMVAFAAAAVLLTPARALPPVPGPPGAATPGPSSTPNPAAYLPVGSVIELVLDDSVDSKKTRPGTSARIHLAKALVVGRVQVAPAGAPGTLRIVATRPASGGNEDGAVELDLEPLALPGHGILPLSLTKSYITVETSAGKQSTRDVLDTAEDILIPGHAIYRALRKGRELSLPPGTVIRARTAASVDASHPPTVVIATPPPFHLNTDVPHAGFTPIPLFTVPTMAPRPTPKPTAQHTPAATASP